MLTLYRRHVLACPHRLKGRDYRRCRCPIWVQGTLAGETIRRGLDLTSWEASSELVRQWEARGSISGRIMSVVDAVARFMDDARARKLSPASLAKISVVLEKQLVPWADVQQVRYVSQLDVERAAAVP